MIVIGVDPGLTGALAAYNYRTGAIEIIDMPSYKQVINKKVRTRIDFVTITEWFELQKYMGAELVVMEAVGGRPAQSASAAFVFGFSVALVYATCVHSRIPFETVTPGVWKRVMKVPGKKTGRAQDADARTDREIAGDIISRADEVFPDARTKFRGAQGGLKLDRAEAALLAKYGAEVTLKITDESFNWRTSYTSADTGA